MLRRSKYLVVLIIFVALIVPATSYAAPAVTDTPSDLINAVNALRAAYGLPAYSASSILMSTAQNQADFMAVTGVVAHTGAGGSTVTSRILAAGYPLAGDLSLGGFRSENIIGGTISMSAQAAIDAWMGDVPHQTTMLSPDLTEIGAGVAKANNGRIYYVIDCARPTTSGAPQAVTQVVGGGSAVPAGGGVIYPVVVNTPNSNGDVIHEVKAGQSLWQIAIDYGVKIDDIKRLNNLFDNNIYPGNKLLIKKMETAATAPPTETATIDATVEVTVVFVPTATIIATTPDMLTPTPVVPVPQGNGTIMISAIAIIALAILGGVIFMLAGSGKKE